MNPAARSLLQAIDFDGQSPRKLARTALVEQDAGVHVS